MRDPRLPMKIGMCEVRDDGTLVYRDDGTLVYNDMDAFPWYTEEGFLGGTVRYHLVAEEVDVKELFKTQETQR